MGSVDVVWSLLLTTIVIVLLLVLLSGLDEDCYYDGVDDC